jgi:hypothetical protein
MRLNKIKRYALVIGFGPPLIQSILGQTSLVSLAAASWYVMGLAVWVCGCYRREP